MSVTLFGLFTLIVGGACLSLRPATSLYALMFFSIANAAGTLSIAGASAPPVNLFAVFLCLRIATLPGAIAIALKSLEPPRPGFVLASLIFYAILTAVFYPKIFQGMTYIFYPDRSIAVEDTLLARPLTGGSGNITQSLYAVEGLAVFAAAHAYARFVSAEMLLNAFRLLALLNVGFAVADILTHSLGLSFLLAPFRSGGYHIHLEQTAGGIRRIIGSFPEPSAFASFSFQMFAGMFVMWQTGVRGRMTFFAMMGNLIALMISTSTTGYAALIFFSLMVLSWLVFTLCTTGWSLRPQAAVAGFILGGLLVAGLYAFDLMPETVARIMEETLNKSGSASGVERAATNVRAWSNFIDTFGMGAGLGSARASSFIFVVLSNLGLIGAVLFSAFLIQVLLQIPKTFSVYFVVWATAVSQIVATLICAAIAGGVFDLGVTFYFWAGIAAAVARPLISHNVFRRRLVAEPL